MADKKSLSILALILVAGAFLRFFHLGTESIWLDERYSIKLASLPLASIIEETSRDVHPPLYYFLLKYWSGGFGVSEAGVRSFSVITGLLLIGFSFLLGKRLAGAAAGLCMALCVALSPFHIRYSQEARGYELMALLACISFLLFMDLLDGKKSWRPLAGLIMTTSLLTYVHAFGFFVLLAHDAAFAGLLLLNVPRVRERAVELLIMNGAVAALFLPWAKILLQQIKAIQGDFWIPPPTLLSLPAAGIEFSGSLPLFCLLALLAVTGCVALARHKAPETLLVIAWLIVPLAAPLVISFMSTPVFIPKACMASSLAWYALVAIGVSAIKRQSLKAYFTIAFAGFTALALHPYYTAAHKPQWRDAAAYIDSRALPGETLLFHAWYGEEEYAYYSQRRDLVSMGFPPAGASPTQPVVEAFAKKMSDQQRLWLVVAHPEGPAGLPVSALARLYRIAGKKTFQVLKYTRTQWTTGIEIYLFEKNQR
ncbi:MAG: hypothetical protein A2268_13750 [Candidatus Raymondbacteria bacterium RifOxyA12_full_50_37]|uniref:Glycosyltransferase RgtA/B/C/D-like domain-containing protein n=1 Tax=Candidatus Raymondbacteria bacterium RIFOXYD12_FULL_49_13 TaxID=1817890 RepID=A0A1F7FM62_UNCRA|nr:MAG: hypothetical protein A2248_08095 [Candidatus Raymondbacteria bacterium RIFOXYA2_FULL_49_16]OGJ87200.1 MAG: hypothetical protein A2350_04345 [Candidatus Raymondbacteria bacterium RifOxyB12_full_50_8]OGJ91673.1 MAG: hypothetical protein A2268_13750 [Candidatus Raymondbacteria bacterium RifOxyA12_full_50_37]OGJ95216.1 MAG: hypothetical protein A2453_12105 [Candidatus Raymondbacteria bacterium RIFOXYC2_FULL_50_21]OGK05994.1 MAG: hypothetical protein A2487_14420 [Candidatus Raymondbacteria b